MKKCHLRVTASFPFYNLYARLQGMKSVWVGFLFEETLLLLGYFYPLVGSTCSNGKSNSAMRMLRAEFMLQFLLQSDLLA